MLESLVHLLELKQLESLELSFNNFGYSSIPRFMGSMKQLNYLGMSYASLGGLVPYELGNLTNLQVLKLSENMLSGEIPKSFGKLSTLRALDLSNNKLLGEIPESLGKLSHLKELDISYNNLSSIASSLRFPSNLEALDLSFNQLSGKIPTSLGKLSKLQSLNISNNSLAGTVLSEPHFANLSSLTDLEIDNTMVTLHFSSDWAPLFQLQSFLASNCKINGEIPPWLQTQINLTTLKLSNANISGLMPRWFHTMRQLDSIDLSNNKLSGSPVFPVHFSTLSLFNNSFSRLFLSNGNKATVYSNAYAVYLENNFIRGTFPEHLGHIMPHLRFLALANNQIDGPIPNSLCQSMDLAELDMRNNSLTGVIPNCWGLGKFMPLLQYLTLSYNQITGPIPNSVGQMMPNLKYLRLSNNQISGSIPNSLCQLKTLKLLDFQYNSLSGEIPNCLSNISSLFLVRFSYNKLEGHVPCFNIRDSYTSESSKTFYLHLNDNMLSGEIPSCLSGVTKLRVLDIGGNQLSGKMIKWFSVEKYKELQILRLRGNKFSGTIPSHICSLPWLQIMDLGFNHFTGSIPLCLSNLTAMVTPNAPPYYSHDLFLSGVSEVIQGMERAYTSTLKYLVDIDLSCNNLVGSIPDDMTKISGLLSLNLSYNQLAGTIPKNIGDLKSLISLDLSKNNLIGNIPTSLSELYSLSHLNLSYNNLSGQIPTGNQLQTLSDQASIYAENPYLCGDFLPKKCRSHVDEQDKGRSNKDKGDNKEKLEKMGLVLVVMSGFATGFWGVVGCLVLNRKWRHAFFRRLEDGHNWLYVIVALKVRVAKAKINKIPENIGRLKKLISLDLSKNKLRGDIPNSISEIFTLSYLNLSYNNLSGQIPTGNQLQTLSDQTSIYAGNPYLCGDFLPKKCKSKEDEQDKGRSNKHKGDNKEKFEKMGFDLVVMSGFATGFWGVVGCLVLNRRWRHAFFRRLEDGYNWLYVIVVLKVRVLKAKMKRGE
ncbi:receptor-like protein EIX2 [Silene latifolia]|uniref:receptor-like protein EIX2 n=1 Tax=Silene latifolia TaxID=37657 RepID=UPI003D782B1B